MVALSVLFAEEAETACKSGNFMAAGAALLKCIARATPVAAAGAVLAVSQHSGVGFSDKDFGGHKLARAIAKGEHLNAWQTKRCRKLAARYATQAMTKVWGEGGSAGAKRPRRLFKGRDPWSGDELRWGDDDGSGDEAMEVGGAADSSEEEEAEREEADSDLGSFITPDEEDEDADSSEEEEAEREEADSDSGADTSSSDEDDEESRETESSEEEEEADEEEEEEEVKRGGPGTPQEGAPQRQGRQACARRRANWSTMRRRTKTPTGPRRRIARRSRATAESSKPRRRHLRPASPSRTHARFKTDAETDARLALQTPRGSFAGSVELPFRSARH